MKKRDGNYLLFMSLLFGAVFLSGCSVFLDNPAPEADCAFVQNKHEQRVSWKANLPMRVRVHKDVPEAARDSITEAAMRWNLISTKNVIQIVEWDVTGSVASGHADRKPTIYWQKDWDGERSTEQARTTIVWKKNQIQDADIKINAKDFQFSYASEKLNTSKVDMVSLLVHEFGHALGFAHSEGASSVMNPYLSKGRERREVKELADLQSYSCEYGHQIIKPTVLAAALGGDAPNNGEGIIESDDSSVDDDTLVDVDSSDDESDDENLASEDNAAGQDLGVVSAGETSDI